ncbi:MAG: hypothetical protein FJW90_06500 [Actinobacteria bacterium]|nr:hypothetical protein [Actinomycetota bacterium]
MRAGDRAIGIALGILLGVAIVAAFVFLGSGETIDDPGISGEGQIEQAAPPQGQGGSEGQSERPQP